MTELEVASSDPTNLTTGILRDGDEWEVACLLPRPMSSPAAGVIKDLLYVAWCCDVRIENDVWVMSLEVWTISVTDP